MHFMISSEALHKAIQKVIQVSPSRSTDDSKEIQIEAVENGLIIRRQGSEVYAEWFIYGSVRQTGSVIASSQSLKFLEFVVGDIVGDYKDDILTFSPGETKVKTMDDDPDYFIKKKPEGEWFDCSPEILHTLWANPDERDIVLGHAFLTKNSISATNKFNFSVVELPNFPFEATFPLTVLKGIPVKDDEIFQVSRSEKMIWFKRGGFVMATPLSNPGVDPSKLFQTIMQVDLSQGDYFLMDQIELSRQMKKIIAHVSLPSLNNQARCYLEVRQDKSIYFESNWGDHGQVKDTLRVLECRGEFNLSLIPQQLIGLFTIIEGNMPIYYIELPGMNGKWIVIPYKNTRFVLTPTSPAWREDVKP